MTYYVTFEGMAGFMVMVNGARPWKRKIFDRVSAESPHLPADVCRFRSYDDAMKAAQARSKWMSTNIAIYKILTDEEMDMKIMMMMARL